MSPDPVCERVRIQGNTGLLSGELAYAWDSPVGSCLLLNPHPYMGGRMDNPVIQAMAAHLASQGWITLRFDYAGVGESEGPPIDVASSMAVFWETGHAPIDDGMLADAASAAEWLESQADLPLALIGYSFGAFAASTLIERAPSAMILISPTITRHDFSPLEAFGAPKLVLYGENDFATPRGQLDAWYNALSEPKSLQCIDGGDHFFRGQEQVVAGRCLEFLTASQSASAGLKA